MDEDALRLRVIVARAIAYANGDDYDAVPADKGEWTRCRGIVNGVPRSIDRPFREDYDEMAQGAIDAYEAERGRQGYEWRRKA